MSKTILITGSTDGIGKLAAKNLAEQGHHVYVHGRNPEKLEKLVVELKAETGNANIDGFVADFSDLKAVKKMADEVNEKLSSLDVLINNAGVFKTGLAKNAEGMDLRFVVNYFAPIVLTDTVLPLLKQKGGRIVNLSSAAQAPVSLTALTGQADISEQESYAQSKLALTMWSFDLAKQLENISVIALNPGSLLNTNMVKEAFGTHWSGPEKGGNIITALAVDEEYQGETGKYFDNDKGQVRGVFGPAHADAYNDAKIKELLEKTREILS